MTLAAGVLYGGAGRGTMAAIKRGEIWWARLREPVRSQPGSRRPIVVVQANDLNRGHIRTVVAVPLTSNRELAKHPGNVLIPNVLTGLREDSVANVSQVVTVDKAFLAERVCQLQEPYLSKIDEGLRRILSLE